MARFKPVECYEDLPQTDEARESFILDFKATVDAKAWWELAKDIAALANHVGGTLIVGADEPEVGGKPSYHGLSAEEAERVAKAYENAVLEHCLPHPLVQVTPVPLPTGKQVVAVNVEPFPDQPVGARAALLNRNDQPDTSKAWQFPMRVGRHTRPLTPDQLPLLTNARVRRNVVLLEQIPSPTQSEPAFLVWRHPRNFTSDAPVTTTLTALQVDVLANLLTVAFSADSARIEDWIPLDDVETTWRTKDGWMIRVRGYLSEGRKYVSNPANAAFR